MNRQGMCRLGMTLALGAFLSGAGAAAAEEQTWRVGNDQYVIRLGGLDLDSVGGRRALYNRVQFAARQLCRNTGVRRTMCESQAQGRAIGEAGPRVQRAFALARTEAQDTVTVLARSR